MTIAKSLEGGIEAIYEAEFSLLTKYFSCIAGRSTWEPTTDRTTNGGVGKGPNSS